PGDGNHGSTQRVLSACLPCGAHPSGAFCRSIPLRIMDDFTLPAMTERVTQWQHTTDRGLWLGLFKQPFHDADGYELHFMWIAPGRGIGERFRMEQEAIPGLIKALQEAKAFVAASRDAESSRTPRP